jgi:hypothetical protein
VGPVLVVVNSKDPAELEYKCIQMVVNWEEVVLVVALMNSKDLAEWVYINKFFE